MYSRQCDQQKFDIEALKGDHKGELDQLRQKISKHGETQKLHEKELKDMMESCKNQLDSEKAINRDTVDALYEEKLK